MSLSELPITSILPSHCRQLDVKHFCSENLVICHNPEDLMEKDVLHGMGFFSSITSGQECQD